MLVILYEVLIGLALVILCLFAVGQWRRTGGNRWVGFALVAGVLAAYTGPTLWELDWGAMATPALGVLLVGSAMGGYGLLLGWIRRRAASRDPENR